MAPRLLSTIVTSNRAQRAAKNLKKATFHVALHVPSILNNFICITRGNTDGSGSSRRFRAKERSMPPPTEVDDHVDVVHQPARARSPLAPATQLCTETA